MQKEPSIVIQTNASMKGYAEFRQGVSTGGKWTIEEARNNINISELMAVRLVILTYL